MIKRILLGILLLGFGGALVIWGYGLAFSGSSEKVLILISLVPVNVSPVYLGWSWMLSGVLFVIFAIYIFLGRPLK